MAWSRCVEQLEKIVRIKFKYFTVLIAVLLLTSCQDGYRIEGDKVVYEYPWNTGFGTQIVEVNADAKTFETLGNNNMKWGRDSMHVFLRHHVLDFLDRDTFYLLNEDFGKDDKTVVCTINPILKADVTTFKVKEFKDDAGKRVEMGIDKNAAYQCFDGRVNRIESSSIAHFRPIRDNYFKDKTTVWWGGRELPGVNPDTFRLLGGRYSTDGKNVYHLYNLVEGADIDSFKVTDRNRAKDKNHKYKLSRRIE